MSDFTCPFCGSKELKVKSPYLELKKTGEYDAVENFCCLAQRQNHQYVKKNFGPDEDVNPDDISKW